MAAIGAKRLVEYPEQFGFVVKKRPPSVSATGKETLAARLQLRLLAGSRRAGSR
jgi:hypothetical protein